MSFFCFASSSRLLILGVSSLAIAACSQAAGSPDPNESSPSAIVEPNDPVSPNHDPPPVLPRITAVEARGTGCPDDATFESEIADDGQSVTVRLHAYDTRVTRGEAFSIQDCTISVKVAGVDGYRYALAGFAASGWASLQGEGMRGDETIKYYLQGDPVANETRVRAFSNGAGARYDFGEQFAGDKMPADQETTVWSPCGGGRDVLVQSRKVLRNNTEKTGYGFIGGSAIQLQLASRRCDTP
jgi:hypothetical protein